MNPPFFNPKNSLCLFGLKEEFNFISSLYKKKKLPKVLMLSSNKGIGKSTLVNHFLFSIFDKKNYDINKYILKEDSLFLKQFRDNVFSNIIYINGSDLISIKIDDIRNLKKNILKSSLLDKDRFIIFDDIELLNINSLNALLKIIEEPSENNYFILINNNSKPLLETIKSRTLEIKVNLNEVQRCQIIESLITKLNLELSPVKSKLSPGNFIKFNYLCFEHNIDLEKDFVDNFSLILKLYKKEKNILFINFAFFITDYYINSKLKNNFKDDKIYDLRNFIFDNLNTFLLYNTNQNSLVNAINNKLKYE